jgi:BMFP domain-containing protein YqiC
MAQTSNRFLDDLARLMTDAAGAAQGVRREVETVFKGQIERMLQDMNVATREEVEVLRDMVVAAREENERLAIRMKALEERLASREGDGPSAGGPTAGPAASPAAAQSEGAPGFIE